LTQRVQALAATLYGDDGTGAREGVVHVAAVWDGPHGWEVLRIGPDTPRSETDTFALALSRARADVIVTTGAILRAEPRLTYDLPGGVGPNLHVWRRRRNRRSTPPTVVVLSRSGDIDPAHPALHSWARPVVLTGAAGAAATKVSVQVVTRADPSVRDAIAWARGQGAATISIEAGPTAARPLYEPPVAVDELMISVFAGPQLPDAARAGPFVVRGPDDVPLPQATAPSRVDEPSGPWIFRRFFREQTDRGGRPLTAHGDGGKDNL
jgi:riboflavin biosynthesis pyrimidine reductase